jgi:hypothetical protein
MSTSGPGLRRRFLINLNRIVICSSASSAQAHRALLRIARQREFGFD